MVPCADIPLCLAKPRSLKSLTVVKFESEDGDKSKSICPCCRKSLTNNVKAFGELSWLISAGVRR